MLIVTFWTTVAIVGNGVLWVLLKMAPWSAPLSGAAGFLLFVGATFLHATRGMAFGGGLLIAACALFAMGGGLAGR